MDILVEVPEESNLLDYKPLLLNNGYTCMSQSEKRMSSTKDNNELKLQLWKHYEYDRDGYTNAKPALVKQYTDQAKFWYGDRYE